MLYAIAPGDSKTSVNTSFPTHIPYAIAAHHPSLMLQLYQSKNLYMIRADFFQIFSKIFQQTVA